MICNEILVAEKILFDQFTGTLSLISYWSKNLKLEPIPAKISLMIYTSFSYEEVIQDPQISIRITHNNNPIRESKIGAQFNNPNVISQAILNLVDIETKEEGELNIEVVDNSQNGLVLKSRTYILTLKKEPPKKQK